MSLFIKRSLCILPIILLLIFTGRLSADEMRHSSSHTPASQSIKHMSHTDMINSEKDFYKEMIPHHQEAVDTSVLLYISTTDPELKMLTEAIYKAQTDEILAMRLTYARWYNLIPTEAMYQPMMRNLNTVSGIARDVRYVQDMIIHHNGALDMAKKVLTFKGIHKETTEFANAIIKNQQTEIEFMRRWLKSR